MTKQRQDIRTELFLSRRISRPEGKRRSAMLTVATVSVAVSMAVMVVALSVIGGFKVALEEKLTGLMAHITVTPVMYGSTEECPLERNEAFEQSVALAEGFASLRCVAQRIGMVRATRSGSAAEGALLKGIDPQADTAFFHAHLRAGRMPRLGGAERAKEVIVPTSLATLLEVEVGEKIEFIFVNNNTPKENSPATAGSLGSQAIRRDAYKVVGTYDTGVQQMLGQPIITDLRNLQRICGWSENQVGSYEISATSVEQMEPLTEQVRVEALYASSNPLWRTTNIHWSYPQIFDWLATHNINGVVIIVIMLAVALLNMMSALLITIFERVQMIGTLKALGMRNVAIQRLFLWRSLGIIARGVAWGALVGIALVAVQHFMGIVSLDAEAYLLSSVPVAWQWGWWLGLMVGVPAVLVVVLSIPVAVVARIKPEQTLKYQ